VRTVDLDFHKKSQKLNQIAKQKLITIEEFSHVKSTCGKVELEIGHMWQYVGRWKNLK